MTELALAEHLRRLSSRVAELELRVDLLAYAARQAVQERATATQEAAEAQPWRVTSTGGAL